MSTNTESPESGSDPINLKHRITGAGVLIFFGALVLPWLLGPPSEAKKDEAEQNLQIEERHSTFEDQVLAQLDDSALPFEEPEETVYVSKITPVNGKQVVSEPVAVSGNQADTQISDAVNSAIEEPSKLKKSETSKKPKVQTEIKKTTIDSKTLTKSGTDAAKITSISKSTKAKPVSKPSVASKTEKAAVKKVDVGWVVQVELLIDKKGAERLVKQLSSKGFEPHTTIVDTNRGKKTGTRIWLGPFEQRSQAGVENDKLLAKMGKSGFIRVYP